MKDSQIEIVFIGIIILVFALWKITELIKTRCYERRREGFVAKAASAAKAAPPRSDTETFLSQIEQLIPTKVRTPIGGGFDGGVLSTENFTVDTTENEMTIHQRKKIAPVVSASAPAPARTVPSPTTGKEGLENPDSNTK